MKGDVVDCYGGEYYHGYYEAVERVVVEDITDEICVFLGAVEFLEVIGNIHDNPELLEETPMVPFDYITDDEDNIDN